MLSAIILVASFLALCDGRTTNIINGQDVDPPGKYPWQVSLQYTSGFHFCGGSIISPTWILSAAHCVPDGDERGRQVVVGLHDKDGKRYGKPVAHTVKKIIVHAEYIGGKTWEGSDIALLELDEAIVYNEFTKAVEMDTRGNWEDMQGCVLTGWGSQGGSLGSPNILQEAPTKLLSKSECKKQPWIQAPVICAMSGKSGGCFGDSGGPISCPDQGTWKVVGVASFVLDSKCGVHKPTVYTEVAAYCGWVKQNTGLDISCGGGGGDEGGDGGGDDGGDAGAGGNSCGCEDSNAICSQYGEKALSDYCVTSEAVKQDCCKSCCPYV